MKHSKTYYKNLNLRDGFRWCGFDEKKNLHFFVSGDNRKGFLSIYATDEDIENDNLVKMVELKITRKG